MKVNGINPEEIKAQANNLLQDSQKVDLGRDDLEILWQNAKLDYDEALFENVSEEDAIAMFDSLDNEGNTASVSYQLFIDWLSGVSGVDLNAGGTSQGGTVTDNTPVVADETEDIDDSDDTGVFDIDPEDYGVDDDGETLPDNLDPVIGDDVVEETDDVTGDENVDNDTSDTVDDNTDADAEADTEKTFLQLRPNKSQTLTIDGKSYEIANSSSTVNNIIYYVENGKLIIEGSDIKVTAGDNEETSDNIRIMGNRNTVDMGVGDDNIDIEGAMNTIYGGDGEDFIKMRGDYNTADMGGDNDTVWLDGTGNQAFGQIGDDNFFARGEGNVLYGKDGIDSSYFDTSKGTGQEFRIENTISADDPRVEGYKEWLDGDDPEGPPYHKLPKALPGHEVRAYDDNTYTDKYEEEPLYYTEYRDIAYRELSAKTTEDKTAGSGIVDFTEPSVEGYSSIRINSDGSCVTVDEEGAETEHAAGSYKYIDEKGEEVKNPGTLADILERLATQRLFFMFLEEEQSDADE